MPIFLIWNKYLLFPGGELESDINDQLSSSQNKNIKFNPNVYIKLEICIRKNSLVDKTLWIIPLINYVFYILLPREKSLCMMFFQLILKKTPLRRTTMRRIRVLFYLIRTSTLMVYYSFSLLQVFWSIKYFIYKNEKEACICFFLNLVFISKVLQILFYL